MTIRQDEFEITPEQLHNSRRAYFAMVTHIDELVGGLIETLESIGQLDNTYVFLISDHGEMLGERGMWFKFNPYEASLRVPIIMQGPGVKAGHREKALASLVDLMPTFTDIATSGNFEGYVAPHDGRSLLTRPKPNSVDDHVFIESTGESLYGPALIMIEGRKKLVYTRTDPKMFFDLEADPLELNNLADAPEHQEQIARMFATMMERWDEKALETRIRASQKKRMFVQEAMKHGRFPTWDFGPYYDPGKVYVRGGTDPSTTATKQRGRFPYVPVTPPQFPRDAQK